MDGNSARLVRVLVTVVALECALALVVRSGGAWEIAAGRGGLVDYVALAGLVWVIVLALSALVTVRRFEELGRRVMLQDRHLAAFDAPRRRLAAVTHRTQAVIDVPESIEVALQPIVDLASGRWVAAEGLVRFPDNEPPEQWFNDAYEAGIGVPLEQLALQRVLSVLPRLPERVRLSVNASPALILDPSFHEVMHACGTLRSRVALEITEHAAVTRYEDIHAALLPHREQGLRLAVDDTGAGYASFAHVLKLRPDVIKLDRSLLADIDHDAARRAFVTAIVLLGLELGAGVTAEGVETAAELDTLRSLGVDTVQGYLLARPSSDPLAWRSWQTRDWLTHTGLAGAAAPPNGALSYGWAQAGPAGDL
jgi:EAL domain-containing protein (putative c-di-GMP-specific phosphodiesterase class I)